jgi:AcrR family transcriptional regulator
MEKRPYRMQRRAERQGETRRRIVEAAVELHTTIGPARASLSAVAEQAGVQRHTLYAHFPDQYALFSACAAHWLAAHPFPEPPEPGPVRREDARDAESKSGEGGIFPQDRLLRQHVRYGEGRDDERDASSHLPCR